MLVNECVLYIWHVLTFAGDVYVCEFVSEWVCVCVYALCTKDQVKVKLVAIMVKFIIVVDSLAFFLTAIVCEWRIA